MIDDQVTLNGLVMGPSTSYSLVSFNPWESPEIRSSDLPRGALPGISAGGDLYAARRISASIIVQGSSKADTLTKLQALQAAWTTSPADTELSFQLGGTEYFYRGRPRGASVKGTALWGRHAVSVECRFVATDPYYYEASEITSPQIEGYGGAAGGLDFDTTGGLDFPLNFGGTLYDGLLTVEVTAPGYVPFTLWARRWSTNDLTIAHLEQGKTMHINPSAASAGNNYWVLDTRTRTAYVSNAPTVPAGFAELAGNQWFWLNPGTNTLRFTAPNHPSYTASQFYVVHQNAYI